MLKMCDTDVEKKIICCIFLNKRVSGFRVSHKTLFMTKHINHM